MTRMPPSPFLSSAPVQDAGSAVASSQPLSGADAAAEAIESPMATEGIREVPVADPVRAVAGATDDIHEIFHWGRKLIEEAHGIPLTELCARGFSIPAFMSELDAPPLFLRRYRALR